VVNRLRNRIRAWHLLKRASTPYVRDWEAQPLLVLPGVLDPVATRVGAWLAQVMAQEVQAGERWVDMGCGTGVVGLAMASAGADVVCADIDPRCVANAKANAALRRARLTAVHSNLYSDVPDARLLHGAVYNAPFWPGTTQSPKGGVRPFGTAMYAGPHFEAIRRYRTESDRLGVPRVLLALSEDAPDHAGAVDAFGPNLIVRRGRVGRERVALLAATSA
jgi:methylase of polypeptide subunit release factors